VIELCTPVPKSCPYVKGVNYNCQWELVTIDRVRGAIEMNLTVFTTLQGGYAAGGTQEQQCLLPIA
jgi:hypothetical protein